MKTIVFAGGGTAGHIMPNIALINELKYEYNCVYIGGNGMEKSICVERNIPFFAIKTVKLARGKIIKNLAVPFKLHACVKSAELALTEIKPSLIFGKGGYAALPVVLAAKDIPVICHESDFSPGLTTKLCKKRCKRLLCAFEDCANSIKNGEYVGTPLVQTLYSGIKNYAKYGLDGKKPVLGIIGGSSGATAINDCVLQALPKLLERFDIIHMTGKNKRGGARKPGYCPIEFEHDMPSLYKTCNVVLTRAGANALAECVALKIPTVAVPLEKASRGDQPLNARYYADRGAILVLRESELTPETMMTEVSRALEQKSALAAAMSKLKVDGTAEICRIIRQTIAR